MMGCEQGRTSVFESWTKDVIKKKAKKDSKCHETIFLAKWMFRQETQPLGIQQSIVTVKTHLMRTYPLYNCFIQKEHFSSRHRQNKTAAMNRGLESVPFWFRPCHIG